MTFFLHIFWFITGKEKETLKPALCYRFIENITLSKWNRNNSTQRSQRLILKNYYPPIKMKGVNGFNRKSNKEQNKVRNPLKCETFLGEMDRPALIQVWLSINTLYFVPLQWAVSWLYLYQNPFSTFKSFLEKDWSDSESLSPLRGISRRGICLFKTSVVRFNAQDDGRESVGSGRCQVSNAWFNFVKVTLSALLKPPLRCRSCPLLGLWSLCGTDRRAVSEPSHRSSTLWKGVR